MPCVAHARRRQAGRRRGVAAVEFAVIAPLFLVLLLGVWEVGRILEVQQILVNAAREGGRQASAGLPEEQVVAVVRTCLQNEGLPAQVARNAVVTYDHTWKTPQGEKAYKVTVSIAFREVQWIDLRLVTSLKTRLNAEAVWVRD